MDINFGVWAIGAIIPVGLIQWMKGSIKGVPSWVWSLALPIMAFLAAWAYGGDKVWWNCFGIWAVAQIGYEVILQTVKSRLTL